MKKTTTTTAAVTKTVTAAAVPKKEEALPAPAAVEEPEPEEPEEEVDGEETEKLADYQKTWNAIEDLSNDILERINSFSKRTFNDASNYKARQNLEKTDPGKKEIKHLSAQVRSMVNGMKIQYTHLKPREAPIRKPGANGFNRLVLLDNPFRTFMKSADWGLVGVADPDRVGVCTHALATRVIANYIACMMLNDPLKTSVWKADDNLKALFAGDWQELGINPNAVRYTDLQKLVARHITTAEKHTAEKRIEAEYRKKLDDEGEFGKATAEIRDLRKKIHDLGLDISKRNTHLDTCRKQCPPLVPAYERVLRERIAEFDAAAAEIQRKCRENDFAIHPSYPVRPRTLLDAK